MKRVLAVHSLRDSWMLLAGCALLAAGFNWMRMWVASQLKVDAVVRFFAESLQIFQSLLPVPIEELVSPLGRVAFSFEEFALIMLLGLWTVARGSECLAGRLAAGTMEMLLAQPVRRLTIVATHTLVTLAGVVVIAAAAWLGVALGLHFCRFDPPPALAASTPAVLNYLGLGVFITGAATFVSALSRTRAAAVGVIIGFYVVQLAIMVVGRMAPRFDWLKWLTILTAYEPTKLTLAIHRDPAEWTTFWQHNGVLLAAGALLLAASAAIFCHRDVPAPL